MKKLALFLMILMTHHGAYALDASDNLLSDFTKDPTYTIDERKYVSNTIEPFSAVVGLKDRGGKNWCSGTLTEDGIVATAKHCVYNKSHTFNYLGNIVIDYNNTDTDIKLVIASDVDIYPDGDYNPTYDWTLLVPKKDIKSKIKVSEQTPIIDTVVVAGYGGLKILSDQEIRNIRVEYIKYLYKGAATHMIALGVEHNLNTRDGDAGTQFVSDIMDGKIAGIPADTFKDTHRLKASYCFASIKTEGNNSIGCQGWGGNSGGPAFYKYKDQWYLYGTHVAGLSAITNSRDTYAKSMHMVPINMFIKHYKELVSRLKKEQNNEK